MSDTNNLDNESEKLIQLPHHQQHDLCRTRPAYRQGRRLTAVKSYSVISESQHLLIYGVPKINLRQELKNLVSKYGKIVSITATSNYETEVFTECFHVSFGRVQSAKIAKKFLDTKNFYGGSLHICYAPELESLEETRNKLNERRAFVQKKLVQISNMKKHSNKAKHAKELQSYSKFYNNSHEQLKKQDFHKLNGQASNSECVNNNGISNLPGSIVYESQRPIQNLYEVKNSSSKRPNESSTDNKVYVFKKKRRKKNTDLSTKIYTSECNPTPIPNNSTSNRESNVHQADAMGKIIVYDNIEKPKIEKISNKTANKIILKINTKLI